MFKDAIRKIQERIKIPFNIMTKKCTKCSQEKDFKYFSFRQDTKKYRGQCRQCAKGYSGLLSDKQSKINELFKAGYKECGKCSCIKSLDKFSSDKSTVTGLTSTCKSCKVKYNLGNKESIKRTTAKRRYGIDDTKYDELDKINNCEICEKEVKGTKKHIDHCHTTGKVRGILCRKCNLALGHFDDNNLYLEKAIKYLKANQ
tara:strand:+ start:722 stop:1324 length:603 start_codon:yes stop_codon:yes gene_type:complete